MFEKITDEDLFERLARQFKASDKTAWRAAADQLLKGKSFEKALVSTTLEGIRQAPIYCEGDVTHPYSRSAYPGQASMPTTGSADGHRRAGWNIAQEMYASTPEALAKLIRNDLKRGQNTLHILLDKAALAAHDPAEAGEEDIGKDGVNVCTAEDMKTILAADDSSEHPLFCYTGASNLFTLALIAAVLEENGNAPGALHGGLGADPLGELARLGQLPISLEQLMDEAAAGITWMHQNWPGMRALNIRTDYYHNAGADSVQELALATAAGAFYMRELLTRGLPVDVAANSIWLNLAIGGHFFTGVAKLRAARILWQQLIQAFGGETPAQGLYIHAVTSRWNKTRYDPHVNMLRATTESLSAVVGGCNSLHVDAFDRPLRQPDDFSRRIARNIQLILKDESHLQTVIDPAAGAWYVESLTATLAEQSWSLFQEIEAGGGLAEVLATGDLQARISRTAAQRAERLAYRKDHIVGMNMVANPIERPLEKNSESTRQAVSARLAQVKASLQKREKGHLSRAMDALRATKQVDMGALIKAAHAGATIGELRRTLRTQPQDTLRAIPLNIHRGAVPYEALRDAVEKGKAQQQLLFKVLLVNFGTLAEYKSRAEFSRGFYEIAGLDVAESGPFDTLPDAIIKTVEKGAEVVVLCASDGRYPDVVPAFAKGLKSGNPNVHLVVAGFPSKNIDAFHAVGVDEFIHLRCNALESLRQLLGRFGMLSS